jgi:hypothetical protein
VPPNKPNPPPSTLPQCPRRETRQKDPDRRMTAVVVVSLLSFSFLSSLPLSLSSVVVNAVVVVVVRRHTASAVTAAAASINRRTRTKRSTAFYPSRTQHDTHAKTQACPFSTEIRPDRRCQAHSTRTDTIHTPHDTLTNAQVVAVSRWCDELTTIARVVSTERPEQPANTYCQLSHEQGNSIRLAVLDE